ncbi:ADP-ribosylation factor 1 [Olea europaea subsp. europaea]|uniref:ADP-ribosylation factor 1 n=1 Tax=Olea europaea subsp. europaea TaxID=158383 RepID=A0A8S0PEP1_OLEEU|nr:ADP-ribosylation factor 1 [Olea europaea subsp. europaea]
MFYYYFLFNCDNQFIDTEEVVILKCPYNSCFSFLMAGGQTSIRPYWRCYFPNTQAIIYVVDSSDTDRLVVAKEEFHAILEEEELKGAVVLIFANKQDLPGALDDAAVTEALEMHKIKNRQWAIFKTSAIKGEGLFEGLDWLSNTLKSGGG